MALVRSCSRQTCTQEAVCTLYYAYSEQKAVIGPLSEFREPHAYDLCEFHAERLTAPQGWEVVRGDGRLIADFSDDSSQRSGLPVE